MAGFVDQAERQAPAGRIPVVMVKRRGRTSMDDGYVDGRSRGRRQDRPERGETMTWPTRRKGNGRPARPTRHLRPLRCMACTDPHTRGPGVRHLPQGGAMQHLIVVAEATPDLAKEIKHALQERIGIPVTVLGGNIKQALLVEGVDQIDPRSTVAQNDGQTLGSNHGKGVYRADILGRK